MFKEKLTTRWRIRNVSTSLDARFERFRQLRIMDFMQDRWNLRKYCWYCSRMANWSKTSRVHEQLDPKIQSNLQTPTAPMANTNHGPRRHLIPRYHTLDLRQIRPQISLPGIPFYLNDRPTHTSFHRSQSNRSGHSLFHRSNLAWQMYYRNGIHCRILSIFHAESFVIINPSIKRGVYFRNPVHISSMVPWLCPLLSGRISVWIHKLHILYPIDAR